MFNSPKALSFLLLRLVLVAIPLLLLACEIGSTSTESGPTSAPARTTMVALQPTPTSVPTAVARLGAADCDDCREDYLPLFNPVDWIQKPQVSASGRLSFKARIDEKHTLIFPSRDGGGSNVALSVGETLYGSVLPPSGPGWNWTSKRNQWIADTYTFRDGIFFVVAKVDPAVGTHPGLRMCIWTGGTEGEVLACEAIQQQP